MSERLIMNTMRIPIPFKPDPEKLAKLSDAELEDADRRGVLDHKIYMVEWSRRINAKRAIERQAHEAKRRAFEASLAPNAASAESAEERIEARMRRQKLLGQLSTGELGPGAFLPGVGGKDEPANRAHALIEEWRAAHPGETFSRAFWEVSKLHPELFDAATAPLNPLKR